MKAIVTLLSGKTQRIVGSCFPKGIKYSGVEFFEPVTNEDLALLSVALLPGSSVWSEHQDIWTSENCRRLWFFANKTICKMTYDQYLEQIKGLEL